MNSLNSTENIHAVVSRGGRSDLCNTDVLQKIQTPVLFIVGSKDEYVVRVTKAAVKEISKSTPVEFSIIPGASHFLEEPGKIDIVVKLSILWFKIHLLKKNVEFANPYKENILNILSRFLKSSLQIQFQNRTSAARILANMLSSYKNSKDIVIVGIPRGGIIIADIIAEKFLNPGFGVVISKRLRNPNDSERAIGTLLFDGSIYMNTGINEISQNYIRMEISHQKEILANQINYFGLQNYRLNCRKKTVILVDDGAHTGSTLIAASKLINSQNPSELIVAVPVVPKLVIPLLRNDFTKVEYVRSSRILNQ
ncbi:MAG: phosphoribosyltransferase family protein [Candidatus Nitrosocosmicus sp.]|nr:phosphoribosyltransferase family protein [Candidatus Nitrosocosmicus sp.]